MRLYDKIENLQLIDDIKFIIIDSNVKNKDIKIEKILRFFKLYHRNSFLYPQAVKRICEIDNDTLEKIFGFLAENKLVVKEDTYTCPFCINTINVESLDDIEECFDCCRRLNKEDVLVGHCYKVL